MMETTYYLAIIECHNDKFEEWSARELEAAMKGLKAATKDRGSTEIYLIKDNKALLEFKAEIRRLNPCL